MNKTKVWGIHMRAIDGARPVDEAFVAIGWSQLGDLSTIPTSRDAFKKKVESYFVDSKPGAIAVWAGMLYRFLHDIKVGDYMIYPSKADREVNIGEVVGDYAYNPQEEKYPNQRKVNWLGRFPRDQFSQAALYEIGSALTLFQVKNNKDEFLSALNRDVQSAPKKVALMEDDETVTNDAAVKATEVTGDFIIKRLKNNLSDYEFEEFIAHLLECMGYHARVTQQSGDGGVDIIAHRDELGFEPPIIKVQCKQITSSSGDPDVNRLLGTLGEGEYALFVNLGSFSGQAKATERNKAKLRLIDGEQLVQLILENYQKLKPRYRTLLPLKQIYVADV